MMRDCSENILNNFMIPREIIDSGKYLLIGVKITRYVAVGEMGICYTARITLTKQPTFWFQEENIIAQYREMVITLI